MVCRSGDQIMEDAWEMVDEFDRLYNNCEIGDDCEEMLKTVIELLKVLVGNKSTAYGCCETGVCNDHIFDGDDYEIKACHDGTNHCLTGVTIGQSNGSLGSLHENGDMLGQDEHPLLKEQAVGGKVVETGQEGGRHEDVHQEVGLHERVHQEGGLLEQVHQVEGLHEQVHQEGGLQDQVHQEGGLHEQVHQQGGLHDQVY